MVRINPEQSQLGVLRKKSQINWVMGVGVRVFWEGEWQMGMRERAGGKREAPLQWRDHQ
jgi:hypothetical protein